MLHTGLGQQNIGYSNVKHPHIATFNQLVRFKYVRSNSQAAKYLTILWKMNRECQDRAYIKLAWYCKEQAHFKITFATFEVVTELTMIYNNLNSICKMESYQWKSFSNHDWSRYCPEIWNLEDSLCWCLWMYLQEPDGGTFPFVTSHGHYYQGAG